MSVDTRIVVVIVSVVCQFVTVPGLQLTANPSSFISGVTPNVTLRCIPSDTTSLLIDIAVIQIVKDNVLMVTGKPTGPEMADTSARFTAQCHIDPADSASAYLVFTVLFPDERDVGEYTCLMTYFDNVGLSQRAQTKLILQQTDTTNITIQLQLQNAMQQVGNLQVRVRTLEESFLGVVKETTNQTQIITELTDTVTNHVAFFATLHDRLPIQNGDVVVFDNAVFNIGGGYNQTSGIFEAPKAGLYIFNVVCEVKIADIFRMEMMLMVHGTAVMKLYIIGDSQAQGGQQAGSIIYQVNKGSEVKVQVGIIQASSGLPADLASENLTCFSGYFLG